MKSLLIATDYIKLESNEIKTLELNTNVTFPNNTALLLDWGPIKQFIIDNKFKSVQLITPNTNLEFNETLKHLCIDVLNIEYKIHYTGDDSVVIPSIINTDDTFIIRVSYDTTAIIDEVYAKDNFAFFNAIKNANLLPKLYIPNIIDDFANEENFEYINEKPNFILKKRFPNYNTSIYPKEYIIQNLKELIKIKNLVKDDEVLQRIDNSNNIRLINIIYEPNLSIIPMGAFQTTNLNNVPTKISDDDNSTLIKNFECILECIKNDLN